MEVLVQDHLLVEVSKEDLALHLVTPALVVVEEEMVLVKLPVALVVLEVVVIVVLLVVLVIPPFSPPQGNPGGAADGNGGGGGGAMLNRAVMVSNQVPRQLVEPTVTDLRSLLTHHHYSQRCQLLGKMR